MSIKKVALVGATGNIGQPILEALIASKQFEVTALTRADSASIFPSGIRVARVDYSDPDSLQSALRGQDAVISTLGYAGLAQQRAVLDVAVAVGVRRFLPSEFGGDTMNARTAALAVYADKLAMHQSVESYASTGDIEFTYLITGPFLDWCMQRALFGIDLHARTAEFLGDGNTRISTSSLEFVGRAVVAVLSHPDDTRNRPVYVQEVALSPRDLLRLSKLAIGEEGGWTVTETGTIDTDPGASEALAKTSQEKIMQGDFDPRILHQFLASTLHREDHGTRFRKLDNDLLGLREKDDDEVVQLIRGLRS